MGATGAPRLAGDWSCGPAAVPGAGLAATRDAEDDEDVGEADSASA
jgi:hypothetical protein